MSWAGGSAPAGRRDRPGGAPRLGEAHVREDSPAPRRRGLLKAAAVGAAGTAVLAKPNVSRAQTAVLRFQSTWPQRDIFHEFAQDYVTRVNAMAGGRLRLDLLAAGAVVGAFQLLDAVSPAPSTAATASRPTGSARTRRSACSAPRRPGSATPTRCSAGSTTAAARRCTRSCWPTSLKVNVVGFLTGPMPTQPLGWFKKPIERPEQLRGLKYRTVGLAADLFNEMGAAVTSLPGGEIVPALERGVIDGAEFNNPSSDRVLGFPDVAKIYMIQSYHQRAESFEILFNKGKYDGAAGRAAGDPRVRGRGGLVRHELEAAGPLLARPAGHGAAAGRQGAADAAAGAGGAAAGLGQGDRERPCEADPFFKKVCDSQRDWCRRVGNFFLRYEASQAVAYNHFFARQG